MDYTRVNCPAGTITGYTQDNVTYFHSIPFLSYSSPFDPSEPFSAGEYEATEPRPESVALSITKPAAAREGSDYPVLVHIHGGRYEMGSHEDPQARGKNCAENGIIQVNLGYRYSLPGFVRFHNDEPNHFRGIDDCQLGLEWVQRNIESFGGDPTNVTLSGQSAGATSALWLSRKDHFRGGFRRVVAASPCYPRESFEKRKRALRFLLGKPITYDSLNSLSDKQLERGYERFSKFYGLDLPLGPAPLETNELVDIPILVTTTREEFYDLGEKSDASSAAEWGARLFARTFGLKGKFAPWRRAIGTDKVNGELLGDSLCRRWAVDVAENAPGQTWMVEHFHNQKPALHCADLPALFKPSAANEWFHTFIRQGDPGFSSYHPDHDIYRYNLESGEGRVATGLMDHLYQAFRISRRNAS